MDVEDDVVVQTCDGVQRSRDLVEGGPLDMRMDAQQVAREYRGIVEMLENRNIDLTVLLQPGVTRELKISQERECAESDSRG